MLTLAAPLSRETEIRHSRFIAHAERVDQVDAAIAFIEAASQPDATHNCWAYRIGPAYRYSDDGEPSGTAGKPIYTAIEGRGLDHVVVVVTRYFGGTKLGAGGLVRAYGGSAASCLREASTTEIRPRNRIFIEVGFDAVGAVYGLLEPYQADKLDEVYGPDGVTLEVELPRELTEEFESALLDLTRGQSRVIETPGSDIA